MMKSVLAVFSALTILSLSSSCSVFAQNSEDEPDFEDLLNMQEVSGNYASEDGSIYLIFPEGWEGFEFMGFPFVAPGGVNFMNQEETAVMALIALDRSNLEMEPEDFISGDGVPTLQPQEEGCRTVSASYKTVNRMTALQAISECDKEGTYAKANVYAFASETHFVAVVFSAPSNDLYDKYVSDYENSVKTLKLSKPVSIRTALSDAMGLKPQFHKVNVMDSEIDVRIETNSQLSSFVFNEDEKRVSFTVNGQDGTRGSTTIAVGKFLEGPYTVMVDGAQTDDFYEITDAGLSSLQINYDHSVHDIVITGTNVVPEFPLHLVGIIGAVLGTVAVMTRTKMLKL